MVLIRQYLREAQDRHKKYAYTKRMDREYMVGERVFLRVQSHKSPINFRKGSKLVPHFVGPFEILEWTRQLAYCLAMPPSLSCINDLFYVSVLRKYINEKYHIMDWDSF